MRWCWWSTVPHWGDSDDSMTWAGCSVPDMLQRACGQAFPEAEAAERQGSVWSVLAAVASRTDSPLIDLSGAVCPGDVCRSESTDGFIRYRDGTHISVMQSSALSGTFLSYLS